MKHKYIDLSHTIKHGELTYKGLPAPIICDYLSRQDSQKNYENDVSFQISKIEMVSNTGTYMDCPFHRYEKGKDLSEIDISSFTEIEGIVFKVPYTDNLAIGKEYFESYDLNEKAILIYTGWDKFWNTDHYFENHPYLTKGAAEFLKASKVKLVGIDSHNIDNTEDKSRPVHSILLDSEILIVEHLCNLEALPTTGFCFSAIPPKIKGVGTFPIRAMAKLRMN